MIWNTHESHMLDSWSTQYSIRGGQTSLIGAVLKISALGCLKPYKILDCVPKMHSRLDFLRPSNPSTLDNLGGIVRQPFFPQATWSDSSSSGWRLKNCWRPL